MKVYVVYHYMLMLAIYANEADAAARVEREFFAMPDGWSDSDTYSYSEEEVQ